MKISHKQQPKTILIISDFNTFYYYTHIRINKFFFSPFNTIYNLLIMYVTPKSNCPHVQDDMLIPLDQFSKISRKIFIYSVENSKCKSCEEKTENWICLTCGGFFCSRYINSHFLDHHLKEESHAIGLSMLDLSFWCYKCDSYIINKVGKI